MDYTDNITLGVAAIVIGFVVRNAVRSGRMERTIGEFVQELNGAQPFPVSWKWKS